MSESKVTGHLPSASIFLQPGDQDTNLTQELPRRKYPAQTPVILETLSTVPFKLKHSHLEIINSQACAQDPEAQLGPFKLFLDHSPSYDACRFMDSLGKFYGEK